MAGTASATLRRRNGPLAGDVLVSKLSARVEHQVAVVPAPPGAVCRNEATAIGEATRLARERRVDAWLTLDHRHYLNIARYRPEREAVGADALRQAEQEFVMAPQ